VGFTQNTKVGPNALVSITIAPYVILRPPVDRIRQHMTSDLRHMRRQRALYESNVQCVRHNG
jgi:hypothetical protein